MGEKMPGFQVCKSVSEETIAEFSLGISTSNLGSYRPRVGGPCDTACAVGTSHAELHLGARQVRQQQGEEALATA